MEISGGAGPGTLPTIINVSVLVRCFNTSACLCMLQMLFTLDILITGRRVSAYAR